MHIREDATVAQRWERPFDFPPGFWKRQLPTKYLAIAGKGDVGALRDLLAVHPEFLNQRGAHNRTLLWEAARRGRLAAVQWLVEQGADLDATGCYNGESHVQLTPYCAAIYYRRHAVADYLLAQGPHLDIFRAAFLGDRQRVAEALAADPALLQAEDPHDTIYFMPLLAFPVAGRQAGVLDFLLREGAPVAQYSGGLLGLAAGTARMDLIEQLVAHGADVRAVDSGLFGRVSDLSILRYLLGHGASATDPGKSGLPPLIFVARGDKGEHPAKVRLLLEHGASVNACSPQGRTALHYAAAAGFTRVVEVLLDHGADVSATDRQGATALSMARAAGKTATVALLIKRG
jgi:ankyrin repeat protein